MKVKVRVIFECFLFFCLLSLSPYPWPHYFFPSYSYSSEPVLLSIMVTLMILRTSQGQNSYSCRIQPWPCSIFKPRSNPHEFVVSLREKNQNWGGEGRYKCVLLKFFFLVNYLPTDVQEKRVGVWRKNVYKANCTSLPNVDISWLSAWG